jgi:trans-aconitate methyltransferase
MMSVIDNWKYSNVFKKQLDYNLMELEGTYPPHWYSFISLININNPQSMLDVGCGCGSFYELCKRELPNIKYYGVDYSENAIKLAKETWDENSFSVKDCLKLTKEDILEYDLIHMGALLDVLPNGDDVLEYIFNLQPKNILITRMKLTDKESYYNTYTVYDEIISCEYYHNRDNFIKMCKKYGYSISNIENNFYLKK